MVYSSRIRKTQENRFSARAFRGSMALLTFWFKPSEADLRLVLEKKKLRIDYFRLSFFYRVYKARPSYRSLAYIYARFILFPSLSMGNILLTSFHLAFIFLIINKRVVTILR